MMPSSATPFLTSSSSTAVFPPPSLRLPTRATLAFQPSILVRFSTPCLQYKGPALRISSNTRRTQGLVVVASAQSNFLKVVGTAWKVAKDAVEAGTNLVPVSVPRTIARVGVSGVAAVVALVLLKSFLSTLFFVLAMMGLIYFAFISMNADEGPRGGGGNVGGDSSSTVDESLEEARRIMEKYK